MNVLGIDAGASSTKWVVLNDAGQVLERDQGYPITGHAFGVAPRNENLEALNNVLTRVQKYAPQAVVAGISGLTAKSVIANDLSLEIIRKLNILPERIHVMSDIELAYHTNFKAGEGILIYAGTGAIAYHLRTDQRVVRAGGHGFLIDDKGGGFSIGQAGLRTVMNWLDTENATRVMQRPLAHAVLGAIGSSDWDVIREHVYSGGRRAVAAFAPLVGFAAAQGDLIAQEILVQTGRDLATLGLILYEKIGHLPLVLVGGALEVSDLIERTVRETLPLDAKISISKTSMAKMAARMATKCCDQ